MNTNESESIQLLNSAMKKRAFTARLMMYFAIGGGVLGVLLGILWLLFANSSLAATVAPSRLLKYFGMVTLLLQPAIDVVTRGIMATCGYDYTEVSSTHPEVVMTFYKVILPIMLGCVFGCGGMIFGLCAAGIRHLRERRPEYYSPSTTRVRVLRILIPLALLGAAALFIMRLLGSTEYVAPELTGIVIDEKGQPVSGALVIYEYERPDRTLVEASEKTYPGAVLISDKEGRFSIPPRRFELYTDQIPVLQIKGIYSLELHCANLGLNDSQKSKWSPRTAMHNVPYVVSDNSNVPKLWYESLRLINSILSDMEYSWRNEKYIAEIPQILKSAYETDQRAFLQRYGDEKFPDAPQKTYREQIKFLFFKLYD